MQLPPALMTARSSLSQGMLWKDRGLNSSYTFKAQKLKIFQFPLATQICEEVKEEKETEHSL